MKKIFSLLICVAICISTPAFAMCNYTYVTSTQENYSASSPVGHFENYSRFERPLENYRNKPYADYQNNTCQSAYIHDIQIPQNYNRTIVQTEQMIDTRENIDKNIDRSIKIIGGVALVGVITGLIIHACK